MSTETVALRMGAGEFAKALEDTCIHYKIESEIEKSIFIANIAHETQGFKKFRENLNYSPEQLFKVFGGRNGIDSVAIARGIIARGKEAIAEAMYGAPWGVKNLGNTKPGDGFKFIGRSGIHLTGLANYQAYSRYRFGDDRLLTTPEMIESQPYAMDVCGWYWTVFRPKASAAAKLGDIAGARAAVNGGSNGLEDVKNKAEDALGFFKYLRESAK